jgi:hypothetical protein
VKQQALLISLARPALGGILCIAIALVVYHRAASSRVRNDMDALQQDYEKALQKVAASDQQVQILGSELRATRSALNTLQVLGELPKAYQPKRGQPVLITINACPTIPNAKKADYPDCMMRIEASLEWLPGSRNAGHAVDALVTALAFRDRSPAAAAGWSAGQRLLAQVYERNELDPSIESIPVVDGSDKFDWPNYYIGHFVEVLGDPQSVRHVASASAAVSRQRSDAIALQCTKSRARIAALGKEVQQRPGRR